MPTRRRASTITDEERISVEETKEIVFNAQDEARRDAMNGVLQIVQFGFLAFGQFADAGNCGLFGPPVINETVLLAKTNSKIASKVDLLVEVGPYAGLVAALIPLTAQFLVNHKIVKPEMFANAGVVPPEILETKMKQQMMLKAMEEMRHQREMQEEFERMQAEMQAAMNGDGEFDPDRTDIPND